MKLVMTSDTHDTHPTIPPGDVLIHAGDLACGDDLRSLRRDLDWLSSQPHPHKLLVCGNHDLILVRNVDRIPDSIQYLANRTVQIDGIKFHGLTWLGQPRIPQGVDVVISHKPPFSILDSLEQPGDFHLSMAIHKAHPRVCVFGHVHGAAGHLRVGSTDYYNAARRVWTHELKEG